MEGKDADVLLSINAAIADLLPSKESTRTKAGRCSSICLCLPCEPRLTWWQAGLKMIFHNKAVECRVIRRLGRWGWTWGRKGNHMTRALERATFITAGCTRFWRLISAKLKPNHIWCRVCVMILRYKKKLPVSHLLQISTFMYSTALTQRRRTQT